MGFTGYRRFYWVLLGFITVRSSFNQSQMGFPWDFLGVNAVKRVLLGLRGFKMIYWVLLGFRGFHWVLLL